MHATLNMSLWGPLVFLVARVPLTFILIYYLHVLKKIPRPRGKKIVYPI